MLSLGYGDSNKYVYRIFFICYTIFYQSMLKKPQEVSNVSSNVQCVLTRYSGRWTILFMVLEKATFYLDCEIDSQCDK